MAQKNWDFNIKQVKIRGFLSPFHQKPKKHPLNIDVTTITRKLSGATP